jgi:hypothetical protein
MTDGMNICKHAHIVHLKYKYHGGKPNGACKWMTGSQ